MTEYEVYPQIPANADETVKPHWCVESMDDDGTAHLTIFHGNLAEARARVYADFMNGKTKQHIGFPGE